MTHLTYAQIMLRGILLCFLSISALFPLFSNENVLILTTTRKDYDIYNNLIKTNIEKINYEVELVLVEDNNRESDFSGSKNYLNSEIITPPLFSFYIDTKSSKELSISGFSRMSLPPLSLTKMLLSKLNLEKKVATQFPLYLTNLVPAPEIMGLYQEYNIPILILEGNVNPETIMEILFTDYKQENIQTHYYIMSLFNKTYYLNEKLIFYINGAFIFVIIILLNLYSKRAKFHLKHNIRYLITIPFKMVMVFVFYFISELILEYVVKISGSSDFLLSYPRTFFIIKHMILFFIYGISFHIIKDVAFSKSPHFYSHISLYISLIIYFVTCTIYLPLGIFQIWPIIMTIFFIGVQKQGVKRLVLTLNPLIMIIAFNTFLNKDFELFVNFFIESRYLGNILLTILISPYIFLQESFFRFTHRRQNKIAHTGDIILSLLTLTVTITLIAIILELK